MSDIEKTLSDLNKFLGKDNFKHSLRACFNCKRIADKELRILFHSELKSLYDMLEYKLREEENSPATIRNSEEELFVHDRGNCLLQEPNLKAWLEEIKQASLTDEKIHSLLGIVNRLIEMKSQFEECPEDHNS